MKIHSFHNLSKSKKKSFFNWLKNLDTSDPAYVNMWDDDWENKPNTLPYILTNTKKYTDYNGNFHVVYDNNNISACGGIYKASFNNLVALAGTRTWIDKKYRNKLIARDILLPAHKQWSIDNNCKQIALCFNEYNKNLITGWKRIRAGLGKNLRVPRTPQHMFYDDFTELDFPVTIQHTKQWIIYEKLDKAWAFDWNIIKWK